MGDHFVLLVDRMLTESTLESTIGSTRLHQASPSVSFHRMDNHNSVESSTKKWGECRICHDEDEESNMEAPCFCRGSLKYAHRKCVQRWCNEKGDTTCEICLQLFKPGYTSPPPLFHYGGIPMDFRGNWEISRRDLMLSNDGNFFEQNFNDYPGPTSRNMICCRIVAMIFIVLVVLRHTLPFIIYGAGEYSISLFMLMMLRMIGIVLPIYVMAKALTAIQCRRNRQEFPVFPLASSDEENDLPQQWPEAHAVHVP